MSPQIYAKHKTNDPPNSTTTWRKEPTEICAMIHERKNEVSSSSPPSSPNSLKKPRASSGTISSIDNKLWASTNFPSFAARQPRKGFGFRFERKSARQSGPQQCMQLYEFTCSTLGTSQLPPTQVFVSAPHVTPQLHILQKCWEQGRACRSRRDCSVPSLFRLR